MKKITTKKNIVMLLEMEYNKIEVIEMMSANDTKEEPTLVRNRGAKAKQWTVTWMNAVTEMEVGSLEARHTAPKMAAFNDKELETMSAGTP